MDGLARLPVTVPTLVVVLLLGVSVLVSERVVSRMLGISRTTLWEKMKRLGVSG